MYDDLLLLQPPPPKLVEFTGVVVAAGGDQPVHIVTDRELIQERGSESEVAQLEVKSDSESMGSGTSGSSYEWPFGSESEEDGEMSSDDWSLLLVLGGAAASTKRRNFVAWGTRCHKFCKI